MSIKRMRKGDLSDLARMLKIDTEGTKVDLESRIQEHFNAKDLTQDEVREILSRVGDATIVPTTPGRKQQMRAIPSLIDDDDVTKQKKAAQQKASSPVQHIKKFTAKALERSQVAKFGAISPSIMKSAPMKELRKRTNEARTKLSSAATINIATTLFEFILLNSHIWSWDGFYEYNVSFPAAIDSSITYPSLGQFQTYKGKWEPILFWAAISVIIPLIGSFLLMFAKKNFDPFSFAMIKLALVSYFFAEPTATDSVVDIVQNAIGSNLMKISATTSLGFALYEAVMSK